MATLDRRSDRPPYRQIADHLRADIEEGRLEPGDKLPSERELAEHYDVERATAHRAVQELHLDGLVVAYPGRGVFVREPWRPRRLLRNPNPVSRVKGLGPDDPEDIAPELMIGAMARTPASIEVAELLALDPGTEVLEYSWEIKDGDQNLLVDGTTTYTPNLVHVLPQLLNDDANLAGGLYPQLEDAIESGLAHEDVVSARMPTPEESRYMDLDSGIPLLTIRRVTTDATTGQPLEVQELVMPASRNELGYIV